MNRNVENWLRAAIFVIGGFGGFGIAIWGLMKFYKLSPEYFNYTAVGLFVLVFLFALIKFIKDELDAKDAFDKHWDEKPEYQNLKKKQRNDKVVQK
jgi:hypothetical protein